MIDNASSMIPHWSNARELLGLLFYLVKRADLKVVDLHFTSPARHYYRFKTTTDVLGIFDQNRPRSQGHCDMSFNLSFIVGKYQKDLNKIHARRSIFDKIRSQETRPLSLYIFTDAVWQPKCDVAPVIKALVSTLNQQNLHKQQAGLQFIRFGNSEQGMKRLDDLDNLKRSSIVDMYVMRGYLLLPALTPKHRMLADLGCRDIVDTEPANGNVWKMLLGAIMEWFDNDAPMDEIPTSPPSSSAQSAKRLSSPRQ